MVNSDRGDAEFGLCIRKKPVVAGLSKRDVPKGTAEAEGEAPLRFGRCTRQTFLLTIATDCCT